jgi:hypothetical protein
MRRLQGSADDGAMLAGFTPTSTIDTSMPVLPFRTAFRRRQGVVVPLVTASLALAALVGGWGPVRWAIVLEEGVRLPWPTGEPAGTALARGAAGAQRRLGPGRRPAGLVRAQRQRLQFLAGVLAGLGGGFLIWSLELWHGVLTRRGPGGD